MSGTRRKAGQLGPQVEGYRAWLTQRGYRPTTITNMLKDLGQVGLWLSTEGLEAAQLDEARGLRPLEWCNSGSVILVTGVGHQDVRATA